MEIIFLIGGAALVISLVLRERKKRREFQDFVFHQSVSRFLEDKNDTIQKINEYRNFLLNAPILVNDPSTIRMRDTAVGNLNLMLGSVVTLGESTPVNNSNFNSFDLNNYLKRTETRAREEQKRVGGILFQKINDRLSQEVEVHHGVLIRRKRQLVYKNDFGAPQLDKWHKYICDEFLTKQIGVEPKLVIPLLAEEVERLIEQYEDMSVRPFSESIDTMTPIDYEHYCAELLQEAGWECRMTSGSGDQGIDILATLGNIRVVLQCKLYSQPVGNGAVQEAIAGKVFEQANFAAVVSNASFTKSARALAENADVALLHHDQLCELEEILGSLGADRE